MTSTNKSRKVALCLILFFTALGITLVNATTEDNYKNETNLLPDISESTHMENGYKAIIVMNPTTTGIYAQENGYNTELTINSPGIGGKLTENNYQLDLIPEKTFSDTILNIPPIASNLAITPTSPRTTDNLHASYTYFDPDGDPESGTQIRWYKNGALQSAYNDQTTIPSSATTKDDEWHFTSRPKDGTFFGNLQTSPPVTISNSPPTIDSHYPPTNPTIQEGENQEFNITKSDLDGDPLTVTWWLNQSKEETSDSYTYTANYESAGTYNITVVVSDGLSETSHQWMLTVTNVERDIAIINVTTSKNIVGQGYPISITITIANQGEHTETFNVTTYANTTIITTLTNIILTSGNSTTITFTWNTAGVAKGNYTITAKATPLPGETDTTDNTLINGWVIVTIMGDVDGDFDCDADDVFTYVSPAYGMKGPPKKYPADSKYNPNCDFDSDGDVDADDVFMYLAPNYGKEDC